MDPNVSYRLEGNSVYKKTVYDEEVNAFVDECLGEVILLTDDDEHLPDDIIIDGVRMRPKPQSQPEPGPTQAERIAQLEAENAQLKAESVELKSRLEATESALLTIMDKMGGGDSGV